MAVPSFYDYSYYDAEQSFTDIGPTEKHTLDFTAPAQGDYLIFVSFNLASSSTSSYVSGYAALDDSTFMTAQVVMTNSDRTYDYKNCSSIYLAEDLASGSHYVDIDCHVQGAITGYIKWIKIIVIRIDDWLSTSGMYGYAATEGQTTAGESTWADVQTLTFTPDVQGDFLVLGSCEVLSDSSTTSIAVRLDYDSGSEYLPLKNTEESGESWCTMEPMHYSDTLCWVFGGIINIPNSSKTIKLQAYHSGGDPIFGRVQKRRIIALRLGAMSSSAQYSEDTSVTNYTGNSWQTKATKTFTPSQIDYLLLGGIVVKPDGTAKEAKARCIVQTSPSEDEINEGIIDAKDAGGHADCYPFFSCEIKELTTSSHTFSSQYCGRDAADTAYAKASFAVIIDLEAGAIEEYKDITLKTSLESALTYKDVTLKTTFDSLDYKDVLLKTTLESAPIYKDITLKTTLESNITYKDVLLKTTLESIPIYKDIILKTSLHSLDYKDIVLKTSLESALTYKDIALKTSLTSPAFYKDITLKTSFTSAITYKDIALKTTLESIPIYKDILLKTTLDSLDYKDVALKTSLESGEELVYKDIVLKISIESAPTYKDITLKTTLESIPTYKDIVLKTSLESISIYKDVFLKTTLESIPIYKDIVLKTSLDLLDYKDISLKLTLDSLGYKDVAIKTSFGEITITYKDISIRVSLEAIPKEIINFTSSITQTEDFTSSITQTEDFISSITQIKNFISKINSE